MKAASPGSAELEVIYKADGNDMPLSCSLPKGFLITTANCDSSHFYLTGPSGEIIAHGEDADFLFALAWREHRKGKGGEG